MFMGALAKMPEWIVANAGGDPERVKEVAAAIRDQRRREQLILARWALVMLHFEKAFYEDPGPGSQRSGGTTSNGISRWSGRPRGTRPIGPRSPISPAPGLLPQLHAGRTVRGAGPPPAGRDLEGHEQPDLAGLHRAGIRRPVPEGQGLCPGSRWPWPEFVEKATGEELGRSVSPRK